MDEIEKVNKALFGRKVRSFTDKGRTYTVYLGKDGKYKCTCPDFIFRKGSYNIFPEKHPEKAQRGCKHIAKVLGDTLGVKTVLVRRNTGMGYVYRPR